jgi:hypothetical protein
MVGFQCPENVTWRGARGNRVSPLVPLSRRRAGPSRETGRVDAPVGTLWKPGVSPLMP